MRNLFVYCLTMFVLVQIGISAEPPKPYGAVPSERQLAWHDLETYGFCHFTVNTFTGREWGNGDEPESTFNPTDFDADQIVSAFKTGGLKGLILTCKHHDGFCLWPSKYTDHCVKNSKWMDGKGDVVKAISEACKRQGILFGIYLSPWDRNNKDYGKPEYITYYRNQVNELIANYGQPFEWWFDGANGGSGYYGGARETRHIDASSFYDWPNTWSIIREKSPNTVLFSDVGPDVRWCGNESGYAPYPSWSTITPRGSGNRPPAPGVLDSSNLGSGTRDGKLWIPPEVDVSIRGGWFWHADQGPRSPANLVQLYYQSVGRGACLNLNLPPDNRGRTPDADVASLKEFRRIIDETFAENLAKGATITASNTRGNDPTYATAQLLDGNKKTYWASDDDVHTPEFTAVFPQPVSFNVVDLREYLPLGQRVDGFTVEIKQDGQWKEYCKGSSIGNRYLQRGATVTTEQVRVRITGCPVCPAISEFGLYLEPVSLEAPKISRSRDGTVTIAVAGSGVIHYTLDGSEPTATSPVYMAPLALPQGATVKARVVSPKNGKTSDVTSESYGMAKGKWKVVSASYAARGGEAARAIDDNPGSLWHTHGPDGEHHLPQHIIVDLGENVSVKAFTYLPRQDGTINGMVDKYEFYLSQDGKEWGTPAAAGEFANIRNNPILQTVPLAKPVTARYFKFVATHAVEKDHAAVAELGIVPAS
jgi:alpha-L-fucosidase